MSQREPTVFQKIWEGDIPSYQLYRNDTHGLLAMLDIHPATPGHTLVVPEEAVDLWTNLPDRRILQATLLGNFVGRHLQTILNPLRVTKHTIGFGVPHIHDQYVASYIRGDTANLYDPERMKAPVDHGELAQMHDILTFPDQLQAEVDAALDATNVW